MEISDMRNIVSAFFSLLNTQFIFLGYSFTFLDVFYAGIIFSILGFAIGKVFCLIERGR